MEDSATYGSPGNGASPNGNPILAQPPLQPDAGATDGHDIQMTENNANEAIIKQDSATPGPVVAPDDPLNAPEGPPAETTVRADEEMGDAPTDNAKQPAAAAGEQAVPVSDGQDSKPKETIESAAREHLVSQTHAIVLPSYSTWFDMNGIHGIERKAMAEFFNNRNRSKTPTVYKDYRDFMINTYRLNPAEYLTVTACRRNLAGDVCAIMRVHAFLEQWGLINYQVDADQRPSHVGPPFTGHFKIICDTPRGLQAWQPSADPVVLEGKKNQDTDRKASASAAGKGDLNLEIGRNIYEANAKGTPVGNTETKSNGEAPATNGVSGADELTTTPVTKVNCHQCGNDCTRVYFHSTQTDPTSKAKYDVCPLCFTEGRLPANHTSSMYTKIENPAYATGVDRDAPWSDAEILRLLEGLERFDEDWGEIADHVGTRTREECVLQFLQLDIEEKYLGSEPAVNAPTGLSMLGSQHGQLPFSSVDNPVMSVVGFLASLANPASTAAAAHKSADELKRSLRKQLDGGQQTDTGNGVPGSKKEEGEAPKGGDLMDVDVHQELTTTSTTRTTTTTTTTTTNKATLASVPLASIGARAAGFASHEEREMTRLVSAAANVTLQKLEMKLKYFNEMEEVLRAERRELERGRQQLLLDRIAFRRRTRNVEEKLRAAAAVGGEQGARIAHESAAGEAEGLSFQPAGTTSATLLPPSSDVQIKSHEV
ncbi:SWI/SNF and RSC complex subunit Ssr2 [Purpureocillium takamizusanense]|uniref:SWI/SNF and RSC complex subunit Ssr2 n=1 Tax=Purpureocillium takamizusanense TaxID=2060973 RepID=A0A9Q8VER4_9HYPO|nr:SWI/SNF and RSC complex subunit Ssr2 [Purpureocillium takamizusanense]UNI22097.1 SWI/SNF and RSC complex subunit Ssr2 [Purpureocillium takamizusanense]